MISFAFLILPILNIALKKINIHTVKFKYIHLM